jgi:hypothetical protein
MIQEKEQCLLCPWCSKANGRDDVIGYTTDAYGNRVPVTQPTVLREVVGREPYDMLRLSCGHVVSSPLLSLSNQEFLEGQDLGGHIPALKVRK